MDETPAVGRYHRDDGFSLIELFVVVVIIGVLAAIALPGLSRYMERGRESAVNSDLRVAALFMQVYWSENTVYHEDGLIPFSPNSPGVTITAPLADANGFCLLGVHEGLDSTRAYTNVGLLEPGSSCEGYFPPGRTQVGGEEEGGNEVGGGPGNGGGNAGGNGQGNGGQGVGNNG